MIITNKLRFIFTWFISLFSSMLAFAQVDSLTVNPSNNTMEFTEGVIIIDKDPKIDQLIEAKIRFNRKNSDSYYRIQIYNGPLAGAEKTKEDFKKLHLDWPCEMSFETPNYKIRVGKFRTRLEADKQLIEIRKKYSNALLLDPQKKVSN